MQNDRYSISFAHKLTAGKKQWTLTRTDGEPTDIGVVLEDVVEKLTLKSDISTFSPHYAHLKPTKVVTPDESEVVFEILPSKTVMVSSYEVTDGSGAHIGVFKQDVLASLRRRTFVIETPTGRWRLAEPSLLQVPRRVATYILSVCSIGVLFELFSSRIVYGIIVVVALLMRAGRTMRKKKQLPGTGPVEQRYTLLNEGGTQVGYLNFSDVNDGISYDIRVEDSRLGPNVAAAAVLMVAISEE